MSNLNLDPASHIGWDFPAPDAVPNNASSTAYATAIVAASGPCRLFGFQGYSSRGSSQFILVFDAQAIPANGAIPKFQVTAAATANFSAYFGSVGRWFTQGIVLVNSSTAPTLTVGSADCYFDVQWI